MALITAADLAIIPVLKKYDNEFREFLANAASTTAYNYCKNPALDGVSSYTEYYSGQDKPDIVLRHTPVTAITSVHLDPQGYFGQSTSPFGPSTLLTAGSQYILVPDKGSLSMAGLLRRIGGYNTGFLGFAPESMLSGKLSARRVPVWTIGDGNIKVVYSAGYSAVPDDVKAACVAIAAYMSQTLPRGFALTSESLGGYSYSLSQISQIPELGSARQILSRYRDHSV